MNEKFAKKILNLEKAFGKLNTFAKTENPSEIETAGIIQAFEFSFELFWKILGTIAEGEGLDYGSPRTNLKSGFKLKLFEDQKVWLSMQKDRNLTAHTYNEAIAKEIYERIIAEYIEAMRSCLVSIRDKMGLKKEVSP